MANCTAVDKRSSTSFTPRYNNHISKDNSTFIFTRAFLLPDNINLHFMPVKSYISKQSILQNYFEHKSSKVLLEPRCLLLDFREKIVREKDPLLPGLLPASSFSPPPPPPHKKRKLYRHVLTAEVLFPTMR